MIKSIQINNGITFKANATNGYGLRSVDGLATPVYRTTSIEFAGRNGGMVPDQKYGQRLVTIEGGVDSNTPEDQLAFRQAILSSLSFNENVPVVITTYDNRQYLFYAKFQQPQMPITAHNSTDIQLIAIADDWRLYDATSGSINSATVLKLVEGGARWLTGADGSGWRWRTGSGLRWNQGAGTVNAFNAGTAPANVLITITGANQNPVVRNQTTGEQIQINVTTGAGDVITIDTNLKATKLNGGNINALVAPGSTYFTLRPGDNLLTLTNDNVSGGVALVEWYSSIAGL